MEIEEGCRGCKSYYYHEDTKFFGCIVCLMFEDIHEGIEECPCRSCLIKAMCTTPCDDLKKKYRRNL